MDYIFPCNIYMHLELRVHKSTANGDDKMNRTQIEQMKIEILIYQDNRRSLYPILHKYFRLRGAGTQAWHGVF